MSVTRLLAEDIEQYVREMSPLQEVHAGEPFEKGATLRNLMRRGCRFDCGSPESSYLAYSHLEDCVINSLNPRSTLSEGKILINCVPKNSDSDSTFRSGVSTRDTVFDGPGSQRAVAHNVRPGRDEVAQTAQHAVAQVTLISHAARAGRSTLLRFALTQRGLEAASQEATSALDFRRRTDFLSAVCDSNEPIPCEWARAGGSSAAL